MRFDRRGLVPAIVQEGLRGRVLMLAWMDKRALRATLATGCAHFYSRSRKKMWRKGERSGHVQRVREVRMDCDGDVVLLVVRQLGSGACHAGYRSCFFRRMKGGRLEVAETRRFDPRKVYRE